MPTFNFENFGTDWKAVLFNYIKNSQALFKNVKCLKVSDLAMSIISKNKIYFHSRPAFRFFTILDFIFTGDGHSQV